MLKRQRNIILTSLAFATGLKLYLALFTQGSLDVAAFQDHFQKITELGVGAYRVPGAFYNPLNSPPPMFHVIKLWGWLASAALPFGFWLRLPSVMADIGSFLIVSRFLVNLWPKQNHFWALLALALCPASILISGYHGNTDSVMIFFALLTIYLIEIKQSKWAGVVFGLALCVKVVPLAFAPALFFFLPDWRERLGVFGLAALTFTLSSLPYLFQDPRAVFNAVFRYSSIYGDWGWTLLASLYQRPIYTYGRFEPQGFHATFAMVLKIVMISLILLASIWMNRKPERVSLVCQLGLVTALLLFFTPGFGIQYLIWLVPFVPAVELRLTLTYYILSGLFLLRAYFCSSFPLCDSPLIAAFVSFGTWLATLLIAIRFAALRYEIDNPNRSFK